MLENCFRPICIGRIKSLKHEDVACNSPELPHVRIHQENKRSCILLNEVTLILLGNSINHQDGQFSVADNGSAILRITVHNYRDVQDARDLICPENVPSLKRKRMSIGNLIAGTAALRDIQKNIRDALIGNELKYTQTNSQTKNSVASNESGPAFASQQVANSSITQQATEAATPPISTLKVVHMGRSENY
jgi:hypothetical protein